MVNSEEERGKHKPVSPLTQRPPEPSRERHAPRTCRGPTHLDGSARRTWPATAAARGASFRVSPLPPSRLRPARSWRLDEVEGVERGVSQTVGTCTDRVPGEAAAVRSRAGRTCGGSVVRGSRRRGSLCLELISDQRVFLRVCPLHVLRREGLGR